MMKTTSTLLLAAAFCATLSSFAGNAVLMTNIAPAKIRFDCRTDKDPVGYEVGEPMVFRFTLDPGQELPKGGQFYIQWTRTGDDGVFRSGFEPISAKRPVVVKTSIDRPGFVHMRGKLTDVEGRTFYYFHRGEVRVNLEFDGGAGASVGRILPAADEPADFDEFWAKVKEELAKIPVKAKLDELTTNDIPKRFATSRRAWRVSIDCAGPRPATGYLVMPVGAGRKSLPVQVFFDGYGPGANGAMPGWLCGAAGDKIVFHLNAHGYELGREEGYYRKFFEERPGYGFSLEENARPETSYFHGMAMRVLRVFDYLKTLPEWNGKDLIASGGSQGGLQSAWAGSLVDGLTSCRPSVTWCCDVHGTSVGRLGGWRPPYAPGLAYYDAVFHARRIPATCGLEITRAGLGDYVCPPSGLAAEFNAASCPKQIVWMQNSTHMGVPPMEMRQAVTNRLEAGKGLAGRCEPDAPPAETPDFVSAEFLPGWTVVRDGKESPVDFDGRANLRKGRGEGGADLPVMTEIALRGKLVAKQDGEALLGVGADWWWECSVNGRAVFGRTRAMPGGNAKSSFRKTDWPFRASVHAGTNEVELAITLGEDGTVAMGTLGPDAWTAAAARAPADYRYFEKTFPTPSAVAISHLVRRNGKVKFRTAQAYPAGVEYRRKGEKKWKAAWDESFSRRHGVRLDVVPGAEYEIRSVQHVFRGGWELLRGDIESWTLEQAF